jgi:hypothetical protein
MTRAPNKPASANRAMTLLFRILHPQRPVAEPGRWPYVYSTSRRLFHTCIRSPMGSPCSLRSGRES